MSRTVCYGTLCVLALASIGCYQQSETTYEESPAEAVAVTEESLPDPGTEEAGEVEEFVRSWVADRGGEGGVYDIPARAGHDVAGTLAAFHTVHQKDADTYSVCVDFRDGENTYDVDFFVNRKGEDLAVSDHYLHKVNGEAVE